MRTSRFNVFLFVAVLLVAACSHVVGAGDANKFAEEFAREQLAGAHDVSYACQGRDTDGNGYVSCTVTVQWQASDPRREVIPLECAVNRVGSGCNNEGCRPMAAFGRPGQGSR